MIRQLFTLSVAVFLGFLGGAALTRRHTAEAAAPRVVRATRFELVNDSGELLAVWGGGAHGETTLSFLSSGGKPLAAYGVEPEQKPFVTLFGTDGVMRADLRVGWHERPFLAMSDEKWAYRVKLGFLAYDAPSPEDEDWGLVFAAPPAPGRKLASIGYWKDYSKGTLSGGIAVKDSNGKVWRAP